MKQLLKATMCGIVAAVTVLATACAPTNTPTPQPNGNTDAITYEEYITNTVGYNDNSDETLSDFNTDLYYINQWDNYVESGANASFPDMGDPVIVYHDGAYYAYGTRTATRIQCFRSYDLSHWEKLSDCFVPQSGSWGVSDMWAPDVQCINGKWYLYYTAREYYADGGNATQIGVAVADTPYGPFTQYAGENANGETVTIGTSSFLGLDHHNILDSMVFQDDDGELYMYFSFDAKTCDKNTCKYYEEHQAKIKDNMVADIWGVKLKDAVTWDLSTLTLLVCPGYQKLSDTTINVPWERWDPTLDKYLEVEVAEGPHVVKHNGKYYLTYSANLFSNDCYSIGYAVADSPLGEYVKPNDTYLQNMLIGVPAAPTTYLANRYKGFTKGTGHGGIFTTASGELMMAYHSHYNRESWSDLTYKDNYRALSIDYLYFDEQGNLYCNGPTYSLQRTPSDISGYDNIAAKATIRAEGENVQYLTDNYTNRAYNTKEVAKETTFEAGTRSIEIKFDKAVTIKALNIFNSYDRTLSIDVIKQIDFGNGNGIVNVNFNKRYYHQKYSDFIYPHAAFNVELYDELVTDRIVITIESEHDFALGEIEIIGIY